MGFNFRHEARADLTRDAGNVETGAPARRGQENEKSLGPSVEVRRTRE